MWGRLLMIAIGAAAGVIGKMVYDETKSSSSSSSSGSSGSSGFTYDIYKEPPKPKTDEPLDPEEEIEKCMSEISRLESELEDLRKPASDLFGKSFREIKAAAKEAEIAAAKKLLAKLVVLKNEAAAGPSGGQESKEEPPQPNMDEAAGHCGGQESAA